MKTYDWLVIGGGITGTALGYELSKQGFSVLLLEQVQNPDSATRYSYGGLPYWSGTSPLTNRLCREGIACHRNLSEELEGDTEFRELGVLLTIDSEDDPGAIAESYTQFEISPQLLTVAEACEREPLLNPRAIAGALQLPHGHINPIQTNLAYLQAFQRLGGEVKIERVVSLNRQEDRATGVQTTHQTYHAANLAVCAGGLSRALLKEIGIEVRLYFTHAELIETPPVELQLNTLIMPAVVERFALEERASQPGFDELWDRPNCEIVPPILDPGGVQFKDGHLCLGQLSRTLSNPFAPVDAAASEEKLRRAIAHLLPPLAQLPGTWHHCLVAFSNNSLPLVGKLDKIEGIYLFSGFTSTLLFAPPLAKHFARWANGEDNDLIAQLSFNH
ncbi:FAD-binding oxidoreductase [Lusitaniella coriacea LEGE 07157]|uniref:FAD-binding oxidoreductase n=1 Tax=Lusitaniella coriacea LEGE 07157 TaxID=945747 RepID=A0A8J7ISV6_9CYAN|nr:FAD-binding oxidoreductase [Lusitaniella coriacea]MBE9116432.1 FAD-binding oxidoreductase [Lusitaniella coriacea LEGE 07157]